MTYDALGRLVKNEDAAGGYQQIDKLSGDGNSEEDKVVTIRTAMGRTTVMRSGDKYLKASSREYVNPDGTVTTTEYRNDETTVTRYADGSETTVTQGPDNRYGMMSPIPIKTTIQMPSGLTSNTTITQESLYKDIIDPLSIQKQTFNITENWRTSTSVFDFATLTYTNTSTEGRVGTRTIDALGRTTSTQVPGLEPVHYSYDSRGRLRAVTQGTGTDQRQINYNYRTDGFVGSASDTLNRLTQFDYDQSGRVLNQTLPGNRTISFNYDDTGNVTGITPPQKPEHAFSYTPVGLTENYVPPSLAGIAEPRTAYGYNLDKQLTSVIRPDGQAITYNYGNTTGRLESVITPSGQYGYGYDTAGRVSSIIAPGNESLTFQYDGPLQTEEKWQGTINGQLNWEYDGNFWMRVQSVNGDLVYYDYDNDGLMITAGDLTLELDPQNGMLTGTGLGLVTDDWTYNGFGEATTYSAKVNNSPVFEVSYERDKLGRITNKTEIVNGGTVVYHYEYDESGRLTDVEENGLAVAHYEYDANGNRTLAQISGTSYAGTYDDQDRLLTYGGTTYLYTPNGELLAKTSGIGTTSYTYDVMGNLRSAMLPNGTTIEYVIDGQDRRIGRKVNGVLTQGFLYTGQLRIVAELDGTGSIVSRFIHGERSNVPSYMIKGGIEYRIITDHLGSPRLVINAATGTIVQKMDYDEYGNVIEDTNPGFQPFGFAGGVYDRDTGLTRFGARDYDPQTGRWTAKDPIDFDGGDTNLYAYVNNNPINYIDPRGEMELPCDPSGLPNDWQHDPSHRDPNGERWRHPSGETLDWHKVRPGQPGWKSKNHWHHNGGKKHLPPGAEVPDPPSEVPDQSNNGSARNSNYARKAAIAATGAIGAYGAYRGLRMIPSLFPPLWWSIPANLAFP